MSGPVSIHPDDLDELARNVRAATEEITQSISEKTMPDIHEQELRLECLRLTTRFDLGNPVSLAEDFYAFVTREKRPVSLTSDHRAELDAISAADRTGGERSKGAGRNDD